MGGGGETRIQRRDIACTKRDDIETLQLGISSGGHHQNAWIRCIIDTAIVPFPTIISVNVTPHIRDFSKAVTQKPCNIEALLPRWTKWLTLPIILFSFITWTNV